eukprot:m.304807 g.304807  ORF g.304807 m.304807 type:complete len:520 (+) comp17313_c0_seq1:106-1665(+)
MSTGSRSAVEGCLAAVQRPHRCPECDGAFARPAHLARHRLVHTQERPLSCSQCDRRFGRTDKLRAHIQRCHPNSSRATSQAASSSLQGVPTSSATAATAGKAEALQSRCSQCGLQLADRRSLRRHLRLHSPEQHREYRCSVCAKTLASRSSLRDHERRHALRDPAQIALPREEGAGNLSASANYDSIDANQTPHRTRTTAAPEPEGNALVLVVNRLPLHCKRCGKEFLHRGHLRRHERVHTGARPFECLLCHKKFARRDTLREHQACQHAPRTDVPATIPGPRPAPEPTTLRQQQQQPPNSLTAAPQASALQPLDTALFQEASSTVTDVAPPSHVGTASPAAPDLLFTLQTTSPPTHTELPASLHHPLVSSSSGRLDPPHHEPLCSLSRLRVLRELRAPASIEPVGHSARGHGILSSLGEPMDELVASSTLPLAHSQPNARASSCTSPMHGSPGHSATATGMLSPATELPLPASAANAMPMLPLTLPDLWGAETSAAAEAPVAMADESQVPTTSVVQPV